MEELVTPELSSEQIETLCLAAENAARKYISSKVPLKALEKLDISVEAEGVKPITLTVEVDLVLSPQIKNIDAQRLVNETVKETFEFTENYLRMRMRKLKCHSQK
ncbi:MAG: DUF3194 domain-containing protein [Candidatus Bathycorpusculaceae bacterium]